GGYYVVTGTFDWKTVAVSIPVGLLVAAILHGNEWRDIGEDARAGIVTLSIRAGRQVAHIGYVSRVVGAYLALALAVAGEVRAASPVLAADDRYGAGPGLACARRPARASSAEAESEGRGPGPGLRRRSVRGVPGRRPDGAPIHADRRPGHRPRLRAAAASVPA